MTPPKERPILFNDIMVKAILNGKKTQTRRVVKPQPNIVHSIYDDATISTNSLFRRTDQRIHCPLGKAGDRLWVKETWAQDDYDKYAPVYYRADYAKFTTEQIKELAPDGGWRPSIHMPRWASRISLEITEVKVEKLQDITESDAIAEGIDPNWCGDLNKWNPQQHGWLNYLANEDGHECMCPIDSFKSLWNSIYSAQDVNLNANPWVWVISFNKDITP